MHRILSAVVREHLGEEAAAEPSSYPPEDLDDWEGPPLPEYSEYDGEAYDEMVRQDMEGRS